MPVFLRGSISEIYLQLPYALQHQTKWRGTSPSLLSSKEEQINSMDLRCCRLSFLYFLGQTSALLNLVRRRRRIWRVNESVCIVEKHLPCWLVAFIHSVRTCPFILPRPHILMRSIPAAAASSYLPICTRGSSGMSILGMRRVSIWWNGCLNSIALSSRWIEMRPWIICSNSISISLAYLFI